MLIEPKEITVDGKTFVISKLPATVAIEVMERGGKAVIPKLGDFATLEEMMLKTISYVAIRRTGLPDLQLDSKDLVNNHLPDWRTYLKVLEEIRGYNNLFLISGNSWDFLKAVIQMLPAKLVAMLTPVSPVSSTLDTPPSTS